MKRKIRDWIDRCRYMDWAVLYLRLFIGGVMLFHNVGKMQTYNEIIESYPSLFRLGGNVTFVIVAVVEVLLSVLIMMGVWVRLAAALMTLGLLFVFATGMGVGKLEFVYAGIYVFLIVSGGGLYAFDRVMRPSEPRN